jgi:hypothetical protein
MKILCSILLTITFILTVNAQTKTTEPLGWRGLIIDVSSPDDVIAKFGKPEKEETDNLDVLNTKGNIFTQNTYKKEWRVLKYKEIEQATSVRFGFNKDNKLVFIRFKPSLKDKKKLIDAQAFLRSFENIDFKPKESSLNLYILLGKQQSGYILAQVSRGIGGLLERKSIFNTKTIEDVPNDNLDGIVIEVQFISKSLENSDNTNILK